jgi:hypothetical protein
MLAPTVEVCQDNKHRNHYKRDVTEANYEAELHSG